MYSLSEDCLEILFIEINYGERTIYIGPTIGECNIFVYGIQNNFSTINQSDIYDLTLVCTPYIYTKVARG